MMAGYHTDPDGRVYGGFATQADAFADGSRTPRPLNANAYVGSWHADFLNFNFTGSPPSSGTLRLDPVDTSFLAATQRATFDGLSGNFAGGGPGTLGVPGAGRQAVPGEDHSAPAAAGAGARHGPVRGDGLSPQQHQRHRRRQGHDRRLRCRAGDRAALIGPRTTTARPRS